MLSMPFGLHASTITQASFVQGLQEAASAGFSAFEPELGHVSPCTPAQLDEARAVQQRCGLTLLPLNDIDAFGDLTIERAREIFALAQRIGARAVTVCPVAPKGPLSMDEGVSWMKRFVAEAASFQVSLYLEMMCFPGRAFGTFDEALRLAEKSGMKLVLDTFHYCSVGATPKQISSLPREMIGIVHISDALTKGKKLNELLDADRVLPGDGGLPLVETMDAIRQTGYRGGMSVEVFHPKYAKMRVADVARDAFQRGTLLLKDSGWTQKEMA